MVRSRIVRELISLLVAISFILFLLLAALSFDFSWGSYLFLILLVVLIYLFFLFVFSRFRKVEKSEFSSSKTGPIVEYKSPAMEEFDEKFKESKLKIDDNFGKMEFVGTEESKMYHKLECRFAKLIKPKYKVFGSKDFFKKKKFKACSVCKPNKS
jgi:Ca2+/Na+ antiporter